MENKPHTEKRDRNRRIGLNVFLLYEQFSFEKADNHYKEAV